LQHLGSLRVLGRSAFFLSAAMATFFGAHQIEPAHFIIDLSGDLSWRQ
jgi:hypothetical protein